MRNPQFPDLGRPCRGLLRWVDLAATNIASAKVFYAGMFGWRSSDEAMNGGQFTRFNVSGMDFGSAYQLSHAHRAQGVPSHWTPYFEVGDLEEALARSISLGGEVVVHSANAPGLARIALILDPVGALVGLWELPGAGFTESSDAGAG
ncbi:VOC family protein [Labrys neptuniae]|uniref:VOC family protein n=1 Tax=Labrys TaxID=204476 RepID=UPI0028909A85|nr:VOC family protein [Labrys neptuniae]MDT3381096.1 VOC family protein [Labrys neptuniae]